MRRPTTRRRRWSGFTLLELLMVILIIGIILTFILVAARDAVRAAEVRQTQALITKLEAAVNDRLEALLATSVDINPAHFYLATIFDINGNPVNNTQYRRAMVIARMDYIKAELPDVFLVTPDPGGNYFFNFAGVPYQYPMGNPGLPVVATPMVPIVPPAAYAPYILPLGNAIQNNPGSNSYGAGNFAVPAGSGIFGASYAAASGLLIQLGYQPTGYDGVDNNQNGLIDEFQEGFSNFSGAQLSAQYQLIMTGDPSDPTKPNLSKHTHKTARAEMLYALLVSGRSPLGTPFRPEDFNNPREVADTDGDGLLEFVDAWGEPLQFFRWPIHYHSDVQKGDLPYGNGWYEQRQQNSMDTNQQLVNPAWFANFANGGAAPSNNALLFQNYFTSLVDPWWTQPSPGVSTFWDRGGYYPRRAFFSRFLIASSGRDKLSGIARSDPYWQPGRTTDVNYMTYSANHDNATDVGPPDMSINGTLSPVQQLILIENEATTRGPYRSPGPFGLYQNPPSGDAGTAALQAFGGDDITNQQVKGPGGQP